MQPSDDATKELPAETANFLVSVKLLLTKAWEESTGTHEFPSFLGMVGLVSRRTGFGVRQDTCWVRKLDFIMDEVAFMARGTDDSTLYRSGVSRSMRAASRRQDA